MLNRKELVLATRKFAKEDVSRSWFYTITTMLLLCLSLTTILLTHSLAIKIPFSILSGLLIVRAFVIYHDYMHEAILRKSKLANRIFTLFGILVLAPKSVWKSSHDFHHKNNSKIRLSAIGSYPIFSKEKFKASTKTEKLKYLFARHPATIFFGYIFTFLIGMCVNPVRINFKKHFDSFIALSIHITLYLIVFHFFDTRTTVLLLTVPYFIAGLIGSYLFYIQHNFPKTTFTNNNQWTYEGAAFESSSFLIASTFTHWVTGNIGYHHIHHLNARIPFYRLPEVMNHFEELQNPKSITLKVKDIFSCLRLKVWDSELQKMTSINKSNLQSTAKNL